VTISRLPSFLTLRRASNQREALAEAAKYKLEAEDLRTFEALSKVYGSLEKERNTLGHGCFGICETDPDLLFCIDLKDHVLFIVETLSTEARGEFSQDRHARLKENMYVYRKRTWTSCTRIWSHSSGRPSTSMVT
jgi:hypothetical protein